MENGTPLQIQKSKSSKLKALKGKLPKKDVVISELDQVNKKLHLQVKFLKKLDKMVDKMEESTTEENLESYKKFLDATSSVLGINTEDINRIFGEILDISKLKICHMFMKRMKKYIKKEKDLNKLRLDENNTIKKNVDNFIKDIVNSYNSASKEATNNSAIDGINRSITESTANQGQTPVKKVLNKPEIGSKLITNSLFRLYDETKGMSLQDLLKLAKEKKRKMTQSDDNTQKRKRRKKSK